jgi:hypothetical protein
VGYGSVWKVLDEMIADFRKRGANVPPETVSNMKTAKTIIKIVQNNAECGENLQKIEKYLGTVQIYLVSEGEKKYGQKYADEWLARIDEASRKVSDTEEEKKRFVPGLPRQQSWIRIAPSAEWPLQKLGTLAREHDLSYMEQAESIMLICGPKENIKDFVKKIATEHKLKKGNRH